MLRMFLLLAQNDSDKGKASIYHFDERGLAEPVHDNPGFAIIGSGFFTGGCLLLKLLGYSPERALRLDLGMLTSFIIDAVSEVDSGVGPFVSESWLMRFERGKVLLGPLKEEALRMYKGRVEKRKQLFKMPWDACEVAGEDAVVRALKGACARSS